MSSLSCVAIEKFTQRGDYRVKAKSGMEVASKEFSSLYIPLSRRVGYDKAIFISLESEHVAAKNNNRIADHQKHLNTSTC